ncbi:hypothetical protein HMPREF9622_00952 [Cutibacterium modestum HL037PA3]|nr:hypothetical protein HMPREF9622_00952 [Cutibacterium modestum HL037PA3]
MPGSYARTVITLPGAGCALAHHPHKEQPCTVADIPMHISSPISPAKTPQSVAD